MKSEEFNELKDDVIREFIDIIDSLREDESTQDEYTPEELEKVWSDLGQTAHAIARLIQSDYDLELWKECKSSLEWVRDKKEEIENKGK